MTADMSWPGDIRDRCDWCARLAWPLVRTQEGSICAYCVRVCVEIVMTVTPGELRAARAVGPRQTTLGLHVVQPSTQKAA